MNFLESVLIILGIGLDIFAAFEIQGAMLAQIKRKPLIIACAIVAALELLFYFGGYAICRLLVLKNMLANPVNYGEIVAIIVFALLGLRLIIKAIKREFVDESRKDGMKVWEYIWIIVVSCFYTLAAGCAYGLVGTSVLMLFVMILVVSVVMVVGGLYTGLHFGFENKTIAYVAGAVLLWAAGAEILLTKVLEIF